MTEHVLFTGKGPDAPTLKIETWKVVWENDLSDLISKVYGRPYQLQQVGVGGTAEWSDAMGQDTIERVSSWDEAEDDEQAQFEEWLARDPKAPIVRQQLKGVKNESGGWDAVEYDETAEAGGWAHTLIWEREYAPPLQPILNDLVKRGLIPEGDLVIHVWW